MSAIGNYYVHYYASNYQREGIFDIEGKGAGVSPSQKDLQLNENYIASKYKNMNILEREKEIAFLQQEYQKMLYGPGKRQEAFREKMTDALNQLLSDSFYEGAGKVNKDNILQSKISSNEVMKAGQSLLNIDKNTKLTGTQLRHLIREVNKWIEIISKNQGTLEQLKERVGYKNLSSIKGRMTSLFNTVGLKRKIIEPSQFNYNSLKNIIDAIKEIDVPIINTQANQQGELGEWVTPWIEFFINANAKEAASIAVEELINIAKQKQQGKEGSYIAFENGINGLKKYESETKKLKDMTIQGDYSSLKFKYHTSKTDATFSWKPGLIDQEQLASIKNYSTFKNLSVVNNTPLGDILSMGGNSEWAAHYVNTMITHEDDNKNNFLSGLRVYARNSLNKLALYVGLLGYSDKNAPTLFIVFNNNIKQVKIFDPYLLLLKLTETASYGTFKIESTYGKATANLTKGQLLTQHFAETKEARISNIHSYINAHKIHVAISLSL